MLQPKAIHFHYFILKVPCFFQFFGWLQMTNIILQNQFHNLCYKDLVKKMNLLIFQITFLQESQMLLLPQVYAIVTWFLGMTWFVQLMQNIATCANTGIGIGKGWINQILQPKFWIYDARMIQNFFVLLKTVRWFKSNKHLKSIFKGLYSSKLTCNMRQQLDQNQSVNG